MKQGWERKKIDDVCLIKGRIGYRGYTKQDLVDKGEGAISLSPSNIKDNKLFFDKCTYISWQKYEESPEIMIFEGDIIYCKTASIGKMALVEYLPEKATLNPQFVVLKEINCYNKYLYYFMISEEFKGQIKDIIGGTAIPTLSQKNLGNLSLPLPPLPEQQRIVSILDQAFAAIGKAKANAEQNLQNAKELFESYLQRVFEKKGDGWEEQLLSNSFKLKSGDNLTAKKMVDGEFPVFGGNGIAGYHNEFNLLDSNVIVGRVGALCGNVRHINENIWLTDNAFKIVDFKYEFDHSFLTYLLNYKNLRSYARQAAQPVISNSSLQDVVLNFPTSKEEQQAIVLQLDSLRAETQKLEAVYQKKIDDLEELKKSILQKAFAGDLPSRQAGLETEKVVVV
jgi:hypothetical protein